MAEKQYLIEKGGERQYVVEAELAARQKDGWVVLGMSIPLIGASVPAPKKAAKGSKPQGEGEEAVG